MPKKIIAFAGRKGSGKSLLAKLLAEQIGAKRIAFADELKKLCCKLIGGDIPQLNKWKEDNLVFNREMGQHWIKIIHQETNISEDDIIKASPEGFIHTVRELLQVVGTDIIRKYYPDWHVDKTKEVILATPDETPIIIDDLRFRNEQEMVKEFGGEIFFVIRPNNFEISPHISERIMSYHVFDNEHIIINDKDVDSLKAKVDHYIEYGRFLSKKELNRLKLLRGEWYDDGIESNITEIGSSVNPMEVVKGIDNPFILEDLKVLLAVGNDSKPNH